MYACMYTGNVCCIPLPRFNVVFFWCAPPIWTITKASERACSSLVLSITFLPLFISDKICTYTIEYSKLYTQYFYTLCASCKCILFCWDYFVSRLVYLYITCQNQIFHAHAFIHTHKYVCVCIFNVPILIVAIRIREIWWLALLWSSLICLTAWYRWGFCLPAASLWLFVFLTCRSRITKYSLFACFPFFICCSHPCWMIQFYIHYVASMFNQCFRVL